MAARSKIKQHHSNLGQPSTNTTAQPSSPRRRTNPLPPLPLEAYQGSSTASLQTADGIPSALIGQGHSASQLSSHSSLLPSLRVNSAVPQPPGHPRSHSYDQISLRQQRSALSSRPSANQQQESTSQLPHSSQWSSRPCSRDTPPPHTSTTDSLSVCGVRLLPLPRRPTPPSRGSRGSLEPLGPRQKPVIDVVPVPPSLAPIQVRPQSREPAHLQHHHLEALEQQQHEEDPDEPWWWKLRLGTQRRQPPQHEQQQGQQGRKALPSQAPGLMGGADDAVVGVGLLQPRPPAADSQHSPRGRPPLHGGRLHAAAATPAAGGQRPLMDQQQQADGSPTTPGRCLAVWGAGIVGAAVGTPSWAGKQESPLGSDYMRQMLDDITPRYAVQKPAGYIPITPSSLAATSRYAGSPLWRFMQPTPHKASAHWSALQPSPKQASQPWPAPSPMRGNPKPSLRRAALYNAAALPPVSPVPPPPPGQQQQQQQVPKGPQGTAHLGNKTRRRLAMAR